MPLLKKLANSSSIYSARDETRKNYLEATCEIERLKLTLKAVRVAQSAAEGEASIARTQLADADTRVAGKFALLRKPFFLMSLCL